MHNRLFGLLIRRGLPLQQSGDVVMGFLSRPVIWQTCELPRVWITSERIKVRHYRIVINGETQRLEVSDEGEMHGVPTVVGYASNRRVFRIGTLELRPEDIVPDWKDGNHLEFLNPRIGRVTLERVFHLPPGFLAEGLE